MRAILIFLIINENFSDEIEGLVPSDTGELVECEPENVRQVFIGRGYGTNLSQFFLVFSLFIIFMVTCDVG